MTLRPFIALFTAAFVTAALALGSVSSVSAHDSFRPPIKNLYVFGDSLSDTGNMFALSGDVEPPSPPYFDGRFSNGPVWIETLADLLDLDTDFDTPITLDPLASNQAVGGAFTDTRNSNDVFFPEAFDTGILSQVANFEEAGGRIKRKDLVIVWGGANNYVFDTLAGTPPDPQVVVDDLKHAIEDLADLGGRRFLVPNLPDLGRTPLGLSDAALSAALTVLIGGHNAALSTMIAELREDLRHVVIVELDIKTAFDVLLAGGVFPISVTIPCLVQQPDGTRDPTGVCGFGPIEFDATGVLFWDLLHPTTAAHDMIAMAAHAVLTGAAGALVAAAE